MHHTTAEQKLPEAVKLLSSKSPLSCLSPLAIWNAQVTCHRVKWNQVKQCLLVVENWKLFACFAGDFPDIPCCHFFQACLKFCTSGVPRNACRHPCMSSQAPQGQHLQTVISLIRPCHTSSGAAKRDSPANNFLVQLQRFWGSH